MTGENNFEQGDFRHGCSRPVTRREFLQAGTVAMTGLELAANAHAAESATAPIDRQTSLSVGFGAADITPSIGMGMPGGFFKATGKGVRDKLWAVACVIQAGTTPIALVGTDSLCIARATVEEARRKIQKEINLPGENILIGASHTHTGGPVVAAHESEEEADYLDLLAKGITGAVSAAWHSRHPAEIGIGTGNETGISFNRRFLMRDGREITHPGKPGTQHHAEIVRPAGPIDPDVGVLAARDANGHVTGVIVNFACHNTVMGGDLFSADYAGQIRKHLQAHYGEQTPVVFLLGACGDITQVNNLSSTQEYGPEHADLVGMKLAAEAIRTINHMTWVKEISTAVVTQPVMLSIRPDPDIDRERPPFGLGSGKNVEEVYAQGRRRVTELRSRTPQILTEVQAIRIGPLGVVTNGSEYFCDYGLRMKECSPFGLTWMVSLANDVLGYVATPQAFQGGGYEPRTTYWSRFANDTGQVLLEAGLKALQKAAAKPPK